MRINEMDRRVIRIPTDPLAGVRVAPGTDLKAWGESARRAAQDRWWATQPQPHPLTRFRALAIWCLGMVAVVGAMATLVLAILGMAA